MEYGRARRRHETSRTLSEAFSRFGEPQSVVDESVRTDPLAEPEVVSDPGLRREVDSIYHLYRVVKNYPIPHGPQPHLFEYSDSGDKPEFHLEIRSPLVVKLLRNIVVYYPGEVLHGSTITVPEPYMLLWHHHRALRNFLDDPSSDENTKKHLQVLIKFLDSNEADATEFKNFDAAQKGTGTMSFRNAWYLYRPGSRLLHLSSSSSLSLSDMYIVKSVKAARKIPDSSTPKFTEMTLTGHNIYYNGMAFCWATIVHTFLPQVWPGGVSDLFLLPIEHLVNQEEVSRSLRARGLKYWQMQGQHLKEYVGNKSKDGQDVSNLILFPECQRVASSHVSCRNYQIAKTRQAGTSN